MASWIDVANYFISRSINDIHNHFKITPLKLQKLMYFSEGWNSVYSDERLIGDGEFQAWVHGPVIPEAYKAFKSYGYGEIDSLYSDRMELNETELSVLDTIWQTYGTMDAKRLEDLSHQEQPWLNARRELESYESSTRAIPIDDIREFYRFRHLEYSKTREEM